MWSDVTIKEEGGSSEYSDDSSTDSADPRQRSWTTSASMSIDGAGVRMSRNGLRKVSLNYLNNA